MNMVTQKSSYLNLRTEKFTCCRIYPWNFIMQIKALAQSLFGSKKWCFLLQCSANYKYKITTSSYYMHVNNCWTRCKTGKAKKEKEKEERKNKIIKCFDEIKELPPPSPNPPFWYHCTIIFIIMHNNDPETNALLTCK